MTENPEFVTPYGPWTIHVCPECSVQVLGREYACDNHLKSTPVEVAVVSRDALETAIIGGVEVAGKIRDANRADWSDQIINAWALSNAALGEKVSDLITALESIARPGEMFGLNDKLCRSIAQNALDEFYGADGAREATP